MKIERKLKPLKPHEKTIKDKKAIQDKTKVKLQDIFEYLDAINNKLDNLIK